MSRTFSITLNILLTGFLCFGILIGLSFFPKFPIRVFSVLSGSMEPTIHTGSLIFVKGASDYSAGDIVTRKTEDPKVTVTHRIAEKKEANGETMFLLKGDANNGTDLDEIKQSAVIGKYLFGIPYFGFAVDYAKTKTGLILLIVIPAVIIIYEELKKIGMEIKKKWNYRKRVVKRQVDTQEYEKVDTTIV